MSGAIPRPGFDRKMTKDEINSLPLRRYEGEVVLVREAAQVAPALARLKGQKVLGFDTETRPVFRKGQSNPTSLVQLAGDDDVFIFQLRHVGFPRGLRALLADPEVIKAGVALRDDLRELRQLEEFRPAGTVDLAEVSRAGGLKNHGLRGLGAVLLGFRISKGTQVSNWGRATLRPEQIRYAATDAWVSRELYLNMQDLGLT